MKRVDYLIDGFNLYHSVISLQRYTGSKTKWLDIYALCKSYIHLFGKEARIENVFYFSAVPHFLQNTNPKRIQRHELYIRCLEDSGVRVELGRFKEKEVYCKNCKTTFIKHEEKETDVSIGVKLMELFFQDKCDVAALVTGDTDLFPAVERCQKLFKEKKIVFCFPYRRKNLELSKLAPDSFSINKSQYIRHQFPNPLVLKTGDSVSKPDSW